MLEKKELSPIPPNAPRWEPGTDAASIHVPGLDTSAPISDQVEQIEQLITLKLQNIDTNFSKMQQVMSNRILPAFKRYAVTTEPVREAAKFWTSFYETAAQVRLPTYDNLPDPSSEDQSQEKLADTTVREQSQGTTTLSLHPPTAFDPDRTPSESSFMPAHGAISSTPAAASRYRPSQDPHSTFESQDSEALFSETIESPLVRLDRDIRNFSLEDSPSQRSLAPGPHAAIEQSSYVDDDTVHAAMPQRSLDKGKGKAREPSLRENVLRSTASPLGARARPRVSISADRNPYLPEGTRPRDWSGVVDLRDSQAATPQRNRSYVPSRQPLVATPRDDDDDDDESWYPPNMSPPVMVPFKPIAALSIGRSPRKEAAARIGNDLVRATPKLPPPESLWTPETERSLSSALSPPSASRWRRDASTTSTGTDSTLENLMRRVQSYGRPGAEPSASLSSISGSLPVRQPPPSNYVPSRGARDQSSISSSADPHGRTYEEPTPAPAPIASAPLLAAAVSAPLGREPAFSIPEAEPVTPQPYMYDQNYDAYDQDDMSADSSFDSLDDDEVNDTAHPSAAFLLASANHTDDSFDSSTSSEADDVDIGLAMPVHPFARAVVADDGFDDEESFDEDDLLADAAATGTVEETVFGLPPAQRAARESAALGPDGRLRLHGAHASDYGAADLPLESPTPYGSGDVPHLRR